MFFVTKRFSESLSFNPFSSITILNFWAYVYLIKYLIYVHCPSLPPNPPQHPLCNVLHILHHQLLRPQYPTVDPPLRMKVEHHSIRQDRKSTRLNSSHVAISYAVFCLKKKYEIRGTDYPI